MRPASVEALEKLLAVKARRLRYPPTPDMVAAVQTRIRASRRVHLMGGLRAAIVLAVVILIVLSVVPQARALVAGWFQIGLIRIEPQGPSAAPSGLGADGPGIAGPEARPSSTAESLPSGLAGLSGITSLEGVEALRHAPIALPTYPPDLGVPDAVVYQPAFDLVVLVWRADADRSRISLALFEFLSNDPIAKKVAPTILEETTVGSAPALWLEGPYPLRVSNGDYEWRSLVTGRSLVWERAGVTYRLESSLPLDEVRRIAESIP